MIKSHIFLLCWALLLLFAGKSGAQNSPVSAGGKATGPGGTVSYTIGQVNYQSKGDNNIAMTEGVQQPYEISVVNGIEKPGIELSTVYPNPTADRVTLSVTTDTKKMHYTLTDVNGKYIRYERLVKSETDISLISLANGTYYLNIYEDKVALKSFQIIKNN